MKKWTWMIGFYLLGLSVMAQTPRIGDVMQNKDGSKGVVFWMSPDGGGGWMVSLKDALACKWAGQLEDLPSLDNIGAGRNGYSQVFSALNDTAGYRNTAAIRRYLGPGNQYAAQVVDFDQGWYLPAAGQLRKLYAALPFIREKIKNAGGEDLLYDNYWSSTEFSDTSAWMVYFHPGEIKWSGKDTSRHVRAVRSFSLNTVEYDTALTYQWSNRETEPFVYVKPKESGDYRVVATSRYGCSNEARYNVFVARGQDTTIFASVCAGEMYTQNGFRVSEPGTYTQTLSGREGCQAEVTLILDVLEKHETTIRDTIYEGDLYTGNGFSAWKAGTYRQTWTGSNGCDSVVYLQLAVKTLKYDYQEADICEQGRYVFRGKELSEPGIYQDTLKLEANYDSIYQLILNVRPLYEFPAEVTTCGNVPYFFRGRELDEAGFYFDSLRTIYGCDSVYTLMLNVNPVYASGLEAQICEGERYTEQGFDQSEPGIYTRHLTAVTGCDSIITLELKVAGKFEGKIWVDPWDCTRHEYELGIESQSGDFPGEYVCQWMLGDGTIANGYTVRHVYADSGRYEIVALLKNEMGCEYTLHYNQYVSFYSKDFKIYSDHQEIGQLVPTVRFYTDWVAGMKYEWDFGDGEVASGHEVVHTFAVDDREYYDVTLTVSNAEDCSGEYQVRIRVYPEMQVPNTITPNGDGINDVFMKGFRLRIIDRNGVEIFKGEDGWDGTRKGQVVPSDTYFYELYYQNETGENKKTGYVTVLNE